MVFIPYEDSEDVQGTKCCKRILLHWVSVLIIHDLHWIIRGLEKNEKAYCKDRKASEKNWNAAQKNEHPSRIFEHACR